MTLFTMRPLKLLVSNENSFTGARLAAQAFAPAV